MTTRSTTFALRTRPRGPASDSPQKLTNPGLPRQATIGEPEADSRPRHALTIENGWREVAQIALDFVQRFVPASSVAPMPVDAGESAGIQIGTPEGVDAGS